MNKSKFEQIRQWAHEKGILSDGDVKTQYVKLIEEVGELADSINKPNKEKYIDSIGDVVVVLTSLAELGNDLFEIDGDSNEYISIEKCISYSYDQIKDRTGKMQNGNFLKDE